MPDIAMNVTNSAAAAFSGASWFSLVIIIGIAGILIALVFSILASFKIYVKSRKALKFIINSFQYFLLGILFLVILAFPVGIFMYFYTQARDGNVMPLRYSVYIILGYIIISFLGWIFKKYVYERIKLFEVKIKELTPEEQEERNKLLTVEAW